MMHEPEKSVSVAARQGKKERFTSLLHHVDRAMLRTAFYAMKRDANSLYFPC